MFLKQNQSIIMSPCKIKLQYVNKIILPENFRFMNTCTACPLEWIINVGFLPPRKNDSDGLMSTLHFEGEEEIFH